MTTEKSEIIVDADDMREDSEALSRLKLLERVYRENPEFKITLFAIPALGSDSFWRFIKAKYSWIDLCPHGLLHTTPRECEKWTYEESIAYLRRIEYLNWTKIFKAPGWQISDGMYQALLDNGYAVADQEYNNGRRPKGLRAYLLDNPEKKHHYHIGNLGGTNANDFTETIAESYKRYTGTFDFIKNNLS